MSQRDNAIKLEQLFLNRRAIYLFPKLNKNLNKN